MGFFDEINKEIKPKKITNELIFGKNWEDELTLVLKQLVKENELSHDISVSDSELNEMLPLKPTDGTDQTVAFNNATINARAGAKMMRDKLTKHSR